MPWVRVKTLLAIYAMNSYLRENAKIGDKTVIISDKAEILIDGFNIMKELILGGESKYGFGHV
ncbi:hypothetical protein [Acetomicrobium sp. S15 = DSM 107314]|uniref:hypothetical protein n=1 Tax=Acetomicrobium sp. S15 = DSM 107314 TaxID=2529858 RepID=UPI0018E126CA|nr:hypothetical protein [Acetomicrobium sp. S15 = DSM 107314]